MSIPDWVALAAPGTLLPEVVLGRPRHNPGRFTAWVSLEAIRASGTNPMGPDAEGKVIEFRRVDRVVDGRLRIYWEVIG
jgi:hypothetical protein